MKPRIVLKSLVAVAVLAAGLSGRAGLSYAKGEDSAGRGLLPERCLRDEKEAVMFTHRFLQDDPVFPTSATAQLCAQQEFSNGAAI